MNRQDFEEERNEHFGFDVNAAHDAFKEFSEQYKRFNDSPSPRNSFLEGVRYAYNLLSKEISEKDEEIKRLNKYLENYKQDAASQFPSQGLKWVKASERLPKEDKLYAIRAKMSGVVGGQLYFNGKRFETSRFLKEEIEWLDESAPSQGLREEMYKEALYKVFSKKDDVQGGYMEVTKFFNWLFELEEEIAIKQLSTPDGSQGFREAWISVEENLPEYGKDVLMLVQHINNPQMGGSYISIGRRLNLKGTAFEKNAERYQDKNQFSQMSHVTHWMPLPEKPKK